MNYERYSSPRIVIFAPASYHPPDRFLINKQLMFFPGMGILLQVRDASLIIV